MDAVMRIAVLSGAGAVENIIEADPEFAVQQYGDHWVETGERVADFGWRWDGNTFVAPDSDQT